MFTTVRTSVEIDPVVGGLTIEIRRAGGTGAILASAIIDLYSERA